MVALRRDKKETSPVVMAVYQACADAVNNEPRRAYLGMSEIGGPCDRRLWLNFHGARRALVDGKGARIFENGHAAEARVIKNLRLAGYQIEETQTEYSDFDGRFKGHCDGVIHGVTKRPHILEIKGLNKNWFEKVQAKGIMARPEHYAQVQCYMGYSGLERALYLVENKNNQELFAERVYFHQETFAKIKARAGRIVAAQSPPPPTTKEKDCWFCPFQFNCAEPELPKRDCLNCRHHRPREKSQDALASIVESLKVNINFCREQPDLPVGVSDLEKIIALCSQKRPDIVIPADIMRRGFEKAEDLLYEILLFYADWAMVEPPGHDDDPVVFVKYHTFDLTKARWTPDPAEKDWCVHPKHRSPLKADFGCSDHEGK